jgi:hypothetical protein
MYVYGIEFTPLHFSSLTILPPTYVGFLCDGNAMKRQGGEGRIRSISECSVSCSQLESYRNLQNRQ